MGLTANTISGPVRPAGAGLRYRSREWVAAVGRQKTAMWPDLARACRAMGVEFEHAFERNEHGNLLRTDRVVEMRERVFRWLVAGGFSVKSVAVAAGMSHASVLAALDRAEGEVV